MLLSVICKIEGCGRRTQMLSGLCVVHDVLERLLSAKCDNAIEGEVLRDKRGYGSKRNVECECMGCGDKILSGMNNNRLRCVECAKKQAIKLKRIYYLKKISGGS